MTLVTRSPRIRAVTKPQPSPPASSPTLATGDASLEIHLLGTVDFDAMLALQEWTAYQVSDRADGQGVVFLCEHPPLITLGADASSDDVLANVETLELDGINSRWVSRGGGTIVHCPGQLAVYAILPLEHLGCGVVDFRRRLEVAAVDACNEVKVAAKRRDDSPGIWTRGGQVGFFGAATKYGVSTHGLHVNIEPHPSMLKLAHGNPHGEKATSVASLRVRPATMHKFRQAMLHAIVNQFNYKRFHVHTGHEQLKRTTRPLASPAQAERT